MKVVLTGTNHKNHESDIDVIVIFEGEDTWTFQTEKNDFTISCLTKVMNLLKDAES